MPKDFDIITHCFEQKEDIHLHWIADVHFGAQEHLTREWEDFCAKILDDKNSYIVLGGDLLNNGIKSSVSNVYDEVMRPREAKKIMCEMLAPLKERILCSVSGNHERRSAKEVDDDPMYDIMCKLDLEDYHRENIAFLKIQIGSKRENSEHMNTYSLVCLHGAGGGALSGGVINRNERFGYIFDGADALLVAHSHKPMISQPSKIMIDTHNNRVTVKPFKVIVASSWLSYGGYAIRKQLLPTSHTPQIITLSARHDRKKITVTM